MIRRSRRFVSICFWKSRPRMMIGMLPTMISQPMRASGSLRSFRLNRDRTQATTIRAMSRAK